MTDEQLDDLAMEIHKRYCETALASGNPTNSHLATTSWDDLTKAEKEANRAQARAIHDKLDLYNLYVVAADDPEAQVLLWSDDQVQRLARVEHDRWMLQKVQAGWVHGEPRDDAQKIHPLIKPYDDLTEAEKDLDREPVRHIPLLLTRAGLAVRRSRPLES